MYHKNATFYRKILKELNIEIEIVILWDVMESQDIFRSLEITFLDFLRYDNITTATNDYVLKVENGASGFPRDVKGLPHTSPCRKLVVIQVAVASSNLSLNCFR